MGREERPRGEARRGEVTFPSLWLRIPNPHRCKGSAKGAEGPPSSCCTPASAEHTSPPCCPTVSACVALRPTVGACIAGMDAPRAPGESSRGAGGVQGWVLLVLPTPPRPPVHAVGEGYGGAPSASCMR